MKRKLCALLLAVSLVLELGVSDGNMQIAAAEISTELASDTEDLEEESEGLTEAEELTEEEELTETTEVIEPELVLPTGILPVERVNSGIISGSAIYHEDSNTEAGLYASAVYSNSWDKYSTNYFYNQMTEEQRKLWDAFDKMCLGYLVGSQNAESSGGRYMTKYVDCGTMSYEQAEVVARIFRFSNPQYYFLSTTIWCTGTNGRWHIGLGIYDAFWNGAVRKTETAKVKRQADEWITTAKKEKTVALRVKAIHDIIVKKVDYGMAGATEETSFSQSAYSVFCKNYTVCAGYAQAFEMLCNGIGVDCVTVTSVDHQWNKVRINDSWYNVDATWADQSYGVYYGYFERSDSVFDADGASHTEESMWKSYLPLCTLDSGATYDSPGSLPRITKTVATPTMTAREYGNSYKVTLNSATSGATIYYTTNGEEPTPAATKSYKYKGTFISSSISNIKAVAVRNAYLDSEVGGKTSYTITYVLNGGTNSASNPSKYSNTSSIIVLANPTRKAYTFEGWYSDEKFTKPVTKINTGSSGNKTLYAKWKGISYKIAFNGNKNTGGSMTAQAMVYASGKAIKANAFGKKGYKFKEWNTKADGSGKTYGNGGDGSKLAITAGKTVTLYAQWTKVRYSITYNMNNGKNSTNNPVHYYVTSNTIMLRKPTRTGYTFVGWYTDSKYKNKITSIVKGSTGNKKLYAKWTANKYNITFNGNRNSGGKMTAMSGCRFTATYTLKSNTFKRTGYKFAGWNTKADGTGKSYANGASVKNLTSKANGTVILYAQWKK